MFADLDSFRTHGGTIPPEFSTQDSKPDLVLVDRSSPRTAITLIELTIPWDSEEAVTAAEKRKVARYSDLVREISDKARVELVTLEIGARWLITQQNKSKLTHICNKWKVRKISAILTTVSKLALVGSRVIWNGRNSPTWGNTDM